MAESIASDLAAKLLGYFGTLAAEEIGSYFGGREKLNQLEGIMRIIQARLIDAEKRCEGEDGALIKLWLRRLKQVLYRLEDLFDEVVIADTRKDERATRKLTKVVCFCISKLDDLKFNKMVNAEVDDIMRDLDGLTSNMNKFNLREYSHNEQLALNVIKGRETDPFVTEDEIIGRDEDKSEIVGMLLAQDCVGDESLSVIPIVGMGGLGKTTLAQLAYNDKDVQQHFDLKSWACISEISSFQELASKVLQAITDDKCNLNNIEVIKLSLQNAVNDRRFLLVLDDVWDEDRENWLPLRNLLCGGKKGSKVILTTRSQVVASNVATVEPYKLKGLADDKSWALFRSLAFRAGEEEGNPNLSSIGKEIVKKCVNVPLAIRTIAGILYSRDTEEEWRHFKDTDIRMLEHKENKIMATLKLSYDHLPPQLKQCFAYCSLFPKGYKFDKKRLIWLWMSQGFVKPLDQNQCLEDAGHIYFMELLRGCFFQDVGRDSYGEIATCKMHDLLHDLACMVGDECHMFDGPTEYVGDNIIRHLSVYDAESKRQGLASWLLGSMQLRSLLFIKSYSFHTEMNTKHICTEMKFLRSLDFWGCHGWDVPIPNWIGELKHLRYLRTRVPHGGLPDGITRLQHLQTLDLGDRNICMNLPRQFNKLTNLRHLKLGGLNDMPPGFGKLKSLVELDRFTVGENNGTDALSSMKLGGELVVCFKKWRPNMIVESRAANLKGKKLTSLELWWVSKEESGNELEVLKWLQPPSTLKNLRVRGWEGEEFPRWGMDGVPCLLPNLVHVKLKDCNRCRHVPTFGRLPNLKYLALEGLRALEYIESEGRNSSNNNSEGVCSSSLTPYFPSLEELWLDDLEEVKGWWGRENEIMIATSDLDNSFPRLNKLKVKYFSKLKTMLLPVWEYHYLSRLERLELWGCGELDLLKECNDNGDIEKVPKGAGWIGQLSNLRDLQILACPEVKELPESIATLSSLTSLVISALPEVKELPESVATLSSLTYLHIEGCKEMKELPEKI